MHACCARVCRIGSVCYLSDVLCVEPLRSSLQTTTIVDYAVVLVEKDEGQLELLRDRIRVFPKGEKILTQVPKAHPLAVGLEGYEMLFDTKKVRYLLVYQ